MKNIETYALFTIIGSLILLILKVSIFLGISLGAIIILYFLYYKKYRMIIFLLVPIFFGSIFISKEEIKENSVYKFYVKADGNITIKAINNFPVEEKYYIKNTNLENLAGFYTLEYRVLKVENKSVDGKILYLKESIFNNFRKKIRQIIESLNFSSGLKNFSKAIILGEKSDLSHETVENYKYVGASHILSISGLHVGIVIYLSLLIFNFSGFSYRYKYSLTFILLTFYTMVLRDNPSVVRAYIMGGIFLLSKIFFEKSDVKKSYCLAIIISLSIYPSFIEDISFLLSFGALFGILYLYPIYKNKNEYLNIFILGISIQICTLPFLVYFFGTLPLFSFLPNIFIVFWGEILITLIFLNVFLNFLKIGFILAPITQLFYDIFDVFINACSKIPFLNLELKKNISIYLLFLIFLNLFLIIKKRKELYYGLMVLVVFYQIETYKIIENKHMIYFPQYKVIVIKKPNEQIQNYLSKSNVVIVDKKNSEKIVHSNKYTVNNGDKVTIQNLEIIYMKNQFSYKKHK